MYLTAFLKVKIYIFKSNIIKLKFNFCFIPLSLSSQFLIPKFI